MLLSYVEPDRLHTELPSSAGAPATPGTVAATADMESRHRCVSGGSSSSGNTTADTGSNHNDSGGGCSSVVHSGGCSRAVGSSGCSSVVDSDGCSGAKDSGGCSSTVNGGGYSSSAGNIGGCSDASSSSSSSLYPAISGPSPGLHRLSVGWGCGRAMMSHLTTSSPFLTSLSVGVGASMNDDGLRALAYACPHLTQLKITFGNVSDPGEHCRTSVSKCRGWQGHMGFEGLRRNRLQGTGATNICYR